MKNHHSTTRRHLHATTSAKHFLSRVRQIAGLACLLALISPASAQQYWMNGASTWNATATNWAASSSGAPTNVWASGAAVFEGTAGTVTLNGTLSTTGLSFMSDAFTLTGGTSLTLTGTPSILVPSTFAATINSPLAGSTGLTKLGNGGLTLGGTNIFTGTTTVLPGAGNLTLDFSTTGAPATQILYSGVGSGRDLVLGGNLGIRGKANTTNTQTFDTTTIGGGSTINATANVTANPLTVNLGTLSRTSGVVDFITANSANITTSTAVSNGILGPWATFGGTNWATKSGSNIVALSSYTAWDKAAASDSTANYSAAGGTVTGNLTGNTLKVTDGTTLGLGANNVTVAGLLTTANGTITSSGGVLGNGSGNEFIFNTASGVTTTISGSNNTLIGAASTGSLTKAGAGTLLINNTHNFTGGVNLAAGTLQLGANNTLSTSSGAISFNGGTLAFTAGVTTDYSSRFSTAANQAFRLRPNSNLTFGTALNSAGGSLTKEAGTYNTLTLTGNNILSGGVELAQNAGVLRIGNGTTGSGTLTAPVRMGGETSLIFNLGTQNYNFSSSITSMLSGRIILENLGTGNLTFSGELNFGTTNTISQRRHDGRA